LAQVILFQATRYQEKHTPSKPQRQAWQQGEMQSSRFATALVVFLPSAVAHGFIEFPPLRAGTAGRDANAWCPHCGNGAGICGDGGQWGEKSDLLNFARGPVTTLQAGEIAEFSVKITAHHKGFFEFRICDKHLDGSLTDPQACLNQHLLVRSPLAADCKVNDGRGDCQPVDTRHPERWYLPPGAGTYKMKYEIPADLRCSSCTLQWQWFTANSCLPGEDTGCYWADFAARGWNIEDWCGNNCGRCSSLLQANSSSTVGAHSVRGCGEEFRNCADIAVVEDAGAITTPSESSEAGAITTPSETSEAASSDTSQQASCSDVWGKCGGKGWQGPYCCTEGSSCVQQGEWYSQCKPGPVPSESSEPDSESSEPDSEPETEPEAESEDEDKDVSSLAAPASSSMPVSQCGSCSGCMGSNGFCCKDTSKNACESHSDNTWCGASSRSLLQRQRQQQFLGLGLIQDGASRARGLVSDEL